ncbi:MAG: GAF domain-containing sensor histidine kinase [Streptosporangiaceae bacterium]
MITSSLPVRAGAAPRSRLITAGLVLPAAALAVTGAGLAAPGSVTPLQGAGYAVAVVWALSAVLTARARERTPQWQVSCGALAAAIALSATRAADASHGSNNLLLATAALAAAVVIAVWIHLLLAVPDGRLGSRPRQVAVASGYVLAAAGAAISSAAGGGRLSPAIFAICLPVAAVLALPAVRIRYAAAQSRDRERLQWTGIGAALAATVAIAAGVLNLLVAWPDPVAPVAAAATALVPLGLIAGDVPQIGKFGGRLLVHVLAVAGYTVAVAVVYIVVILGLGNPPQDNADHELLGLSMLAAAVGAIGYLPVRERLVAWATRSVFGARQAPDEVLRTFGSRMTRAISMDELLLQLAESLRKTMNLTSAEVFTGMGDVLERTAAVPAAGPASQVITARERPVVTRAGISGNAWVSVWLPALLEGRGDCQLRVMPVSHAGQLLGLIVAQRPATGDAFSAEDDRVLTELARQVGLAVHNARLDTALQTTLDELRKQADELRESRARIVASGDAERRRVERNLHDGAQQHLVAMAVNLRLARDILTEDPPAATEMLDQLANDIKDTITELRELAHGIYPPLLADRGLGEALRAAASRSPLDVAVRADGISRYGPEVEAAIYFCCLEALQNAAKHAAGSRVEVRIWEEEGGLLFSVSDNGPGCSQDQARSGHGFVNMADRLGSIGGTVRWESAPGRGSHVLGSIPLG